VRPRLASALLLAALVPAMVATQGRVDDDLGRFRAQREALYVWRGEDVKRLWPGLHGLMADVYWLRTVQYFGGQQAYATDKNFDLVYPLTDITVTLDPRFVLAYQYGAIFLAEPWPVGAGKVDQAVELLDRGARATGSWRLRQYQGYFIYLFKQDARQAADILVEASKLPGAAYWLKTMAADILMRGNERELSRRIWKAMFDQSEPGDAMHNNALLNLRFLEAQDRLDVVKAWMERFEKSHRRRPQSLAELERFAGQPLPLHDPAGKPFKYDEASGELWLGDGSSLWRPNPDKKRTTRSIP
jgi:hypothetical protein